MAAWTDAARKITGKLEVQWNGVAWTDESSNLLSASGRMSMLQLWQMAGGSQAQQPWTANFELRNASDRYSPLNSSSPIYANISANKGFGIAIRFSMGLWNGSSYDYTQIFQGYIDAMTVLSTRVDRVNLSCMDNAHPLLQRKVTTTMYLDQAADDWLTVLATEAGVSSTDFDTGIFTIPFCWCDAENTWTEMNKVASSDGGWIYFDRTGTLTFENSEAWAGDSRHTSSQHTFAVSRVKDFSLPFSWADVYNEVIVDYAPRVQKGKAILYELDEVVSVLPGETETIVCYLRYPATSIDAPTENRDYYAVGAAGEDLSSDIALALTKYAQRVEAEFTSSNSYELIYIDSFRLLGRMLMGYQALEEKLQATDSDIGDPTSGAAKTIRVTGNEYVQTPHQARALANLLRDRTKKARQLFHARDVPAIPDLIPGDLVTCTETGSGLNNTGYIQVISWRYGSGVYHADYEIVDADDWYIHDDYFELGTDVLAATSEKVYY